MTAKEMFEKLGYTCVKTNSEVIAYRYYTENKISYIHDIDFWLRIKEYCSIEYLDGVYFSVELHKAITKQMEELGWLEE